jgi:phage tail sheath protein FI
MPQYLSPGVYVEEVPSAVKPIAGVSTSTAGFIGVVPDSLDQPLARLTNVVIAKGDGAITVFNLPVYPIDVGNSQVKEDGGSMATLTNDDANKVSKATFASAPASGSKITASILPSFAPVAAGTPKLCTNFGEFKKFFGDFSSDQNHSYLAQAVYGYFNNGGSRCYVMRVAAEGDIPKFLINLEAIDEISIVAKRASIRRQLTRRSSVCWTWRHRSTTLSRTSSTLKASIACGHFRDAAFEYGVRAPSVATRIGVT